MSLSSSSDTDHSSARKIRFAPLPSQSDLDSSSNNDSTSTASTPIPASPEQTQLDLPPPPLLPPHPPPPPKRPWLLLRPFQRRRVPPDSTPSSRPSSINSDFSATSSPLPDPSWTSPLPRWPSLAPKKPSSSSLSLTRTQSTTTPTPRPPKRKSGTRMLNGRIYGAARPRTAPADPNANPFANARDEADPVFVEWGYGGMGSVHAHGGHGVWKRLQSDAAALGDGDPASSSDPLGLEGSSGMGWVRKRREAKEKRERELLRDADAPSEPGTDPSSPPPPPTSPPLPTSQPTSPPPPPTSPPTSPPPHRRTHSHSSSVVHPSTEERHRLQAVAVPAPVHTHHHHHRHSRNNTLQAPPDPIAKGPVLDLIDYRLTKHRAGKKTRPDEEDNTSGTETEDNDDDDDDDDEDEVSFHLCTLTHSSHDLYSEKRSRGPDWPCAPVSKKSVGIRTSPSPEPSDTPHPIARRLLSRPPLALTRKACSAAAEAYIFFPLTRRIGPCPLLFSSIFVVHNLWMLLLCSPLSHLSFR